MAHEGVRTPCVQYCPRCQQGYLRTPRSGLLVGLGHADTFHDMFSNYLLRCWIFRLVETCSVDKAEAVMPITRGVA